MFEWKPQYSVQIPAIDAQHQRLFALAADLHLAMAQGKGKAILGQALANLVNYTKQHFADEEQFMRKHNFPEADAHKKQHEKLTEQVIDFQKQFANQKACMTVDLMIFLKTWLENHIARSDQKYAAHIRGKAAA
jgi:hemerythrin-like metal-binding protein